MSIRPMDGGITGWEWEEGGDWGAGLVFVLLTPPPGYTRECYSEAGLLPGDTTAVGIPGSIDLTAVPIIVLVSVSVGTVLTHNTQSISSLTAECSLGNLEVYRVFLGNLEV